MWRFPLGLTSTWAMPWGSVLLEKRAKGAGVGMGLMEELSAPLKAVLG